MFLTGRSCRRHEAVGSGQLTALRPRAPVGSGVGTGRAKWPVEVGLGQCPGRQSGRRRRPEGRQGEQRQLPRQGIVGATVAVRMLERFVAVVRRNQAIVPMVMCDAFPMHQIVLEGEGRIIEATCLQAYTPLPGQGERLAKHAD